MHSHPCSVCRRPIQHATGEPCQLQKVFQKSRIVFTCKACLSTAEYECPADYDWGVV